MDALIRTIKLIFKITNLHSKGLKISIKDVGVKNRTSFEVFNRVLAVQMKICHLKMFK
jgi:hypothetical protein